MRNPRSLTDHLLELHTSVRGLSIYIFTEECWARSRRWVALVIQVWSAVVVEELGPPEQKSPIALWNDTVVWEVTSGVLSHAKSKPWQVCKAEISEPLVQLIYVAVVYSKEKLLKWGLE